MNARDFCYWLQGYFEVAEPKTLNEKEVRVIQRHLNLVFVHDIDPSMGDENHQEMLNAIHNGDSTNLISEFGPCPHEGWKLSSIHGWYDPKLGTPRC